MIGALGSISTTVVLGALALRKGLIPPTGMITFSEMFHGAKLAPVAALEFCGCDIRDSAQGRRDLSDTLPAVDPSVLSEVKEDLERFREQVHTGCASNCGEAVECLAGPIRTGAATLREEIFAIRENLRAFKKRSGTDTLVVVNLASTEPPLSLQACHHRAADIEECIDRDEKDRVRASTLYAYAAIRENCPYINFTPSNAALPPAIVELARSAGVPVMGNDGKTGETLVKSALAPMFACRNLEVLSWSGFNILGNMDGQVLDHPGNKESKIRTKDQVLSGILGYAPHSRIGIEYVPSLGDRKTAWDFIHFRGFLDAEMSLQFVWQGHDSILAAPLVLDMVRLAEFAQRRGEGGPMRHLASFFKAPLDVEEHGLADQFQMLLDYVRGLKNRPERAGLG